MVVSVVSSKGSQLLVSIKMVSGGIGSRDFFFILQFFSSIVFNPRGLYHFDLFQNGRFLIIIAQMGAPILSSLPE